MKRLLMIVAALSLMALLAGCTDLIYTTDDYKTYKTFASLANRDNATTQKQAVLDALGCPDGYIDGDGNYQHIPVQEQEAFTQHLLSEESTVWVYECNKRPDPAEPYRLRIFFDAEGNGTAVSFDPVPGG